MMKKKKKIKMIMKKKKKIGRNQIWNFMEMKKNRKNN